MKLKIAIVVHAVSTLSIWLGRYCYVGKMSHYSPIIRNGQSSDLISRIAGHAVSGYMA